MAHALQFGPAFYQSFWKGRCPTFNDPVQTVIPCQETICHMTTFVDIASSSKNILELGPFLGSGSTLGFCKGIEASYGKKRDAFVTVDIVDNMIPWLKPNLPFWSLVTGDSSEQSTVDQVKAVAPGVLFDLVYIDTVHTYEHLKKELEIWSPLVDKSGVWLFHDTYMLGPEVYNPMADAIKEFAAANPEWEYMDVTKEGAGLGALVPQGKGIVNV